MPAAGLRATGLAAPSLLQTLARCPVGVQSYSGDLRGPAAKGVAVQPALQLGSRLA